MNFDTDPLFQPYQYSVLYYENGDGTATAAYNGEDGRRITTKISEYSDLVQELPNGK
jgi:hypothetical protein